VLAFEWDPRKERLNLAKYGVSFGEALTVFGDPLGRLVEDSQDAGDETRFALLAQSDRPRLLVVLFTERGDAIRLISARRATPRERRSYEEGED
jgi:uncharacterized protein